jgi:hypothetical protein
MHLSISGFPDDTEEEEIRTALEEFGATVNTITMEPSDDGGHTLALVDVDTDDTGAKIIAEKINGRIWKGKRLRARAYLFLK